MCFLSSGTKYKIWYILNVSLSWLERKLLCLTICNVLFLTARFHTRWTMWLVEWDGKRWGDSISRNRVNTKWWTTSKKRYEFLPFFFFVNFFFHCDDENGIQISYSHGTFCLLLSVCTICRCSCFELNTIETDFLKAYRKVMSKPSNEGLILFQPFEIKIHN